MMTSVKHTTYLLLLLVCLYGCKGQEEQIIKLTNGVDDSAGGGDCYIIKTTSAIYYLDKAGGGLSSMIDNNGEDWLGFHNKKGSAHKGEYRGFPNAIHKQDGSYFHAMNAGTNPSTSVVNIESNNHVQITFTSENSKWEGQWDFYPNRCDFSMTKISKGYKYWVQYEGVPNGKMDASDFWLASVDKNKHPISEPFLGDLPAPEWMAFGDANASRVLYLLHHEDDDFPDNYVSRPDMTVLGFGRQNKDKYLDTVQRFSIGFVESTDYEIVSQTMNAILKQSIK
ncbi:hypothetical protein OAJ14_06260 [Polaribacter sp.]|nr:hypothetical protein [Polaribacter sp.]